MVAAYLLLALVAFWASCMVVASRRLVASALWLVVSFLAVAGIFLILGAQFLAAVQVLVYAGSVVVLFVFVVMTVGFGRSEAGESSTVKLALVAGLGGLVLAELIMALLPFPAPSGTTPEPPPTAELNLELGRLLFTEWIVPLEIFSVLVVAVMVGIAALRREGRNRA